MSTEPVAFSAFADVTPSNDALCSRQLRVVFSVLLVVGSLVAVGLDEAAHWQPGVPLGLRVDNHFRHIIDVTPGGIADGAGLRADGFVQRIDGEAMQAGFLESSRSRLYRVFVDRSGDVYARPGLDELSVEANRTHHMLVVRGDPRLAHDPSVPWRSLPALPVVALVAFLIAALASLKPWPRQNATTYRRLWERSVVWPAVAVAFVVPLWTSIAVLAWAGPASVDVVATAIHSTMPALVVFVIVAAVAASRRADGNFETSWSSVVVLAIALIPAMFYVVPAIVAGVGAVVILKLLAVHHRGIVAGETPHAPQP